MSDKIGLFTGSFDPMTLGHLDLIERASRLFDHLYVGIFFNHEKKGYFTIEQRETMVTEAVAHLPNVRVITAEAELAVEVARRYGVTSLVRGLRNSQDFLYESNMDYFNHQLAPELETIYLCYKGDEIKRMKEFEKPRAQLPESPFEPVRKKDSVWRTYRWPMIGTLLLILALLAFFVPLPYYLEMPGSSEDIRQVMRVNQKNDEASGSYDFVTVAVKQATFSDIVYAWVTPFTDIYSEKEMTGGSSSEEFFRINQFYMETSQNTAKYQGLKTAGKDTEMEFLGVYVMQVAEDSTFKGVLNIADTVTAVNDKTFKSSKELIEYVGSQKIGDKVSVTYTEDGQTKTAEGKIIKLVNGKNGIGISLIDRTEVKSDVPIEFATAGIGGPSAGMMFSLSIYTQVADPDLRQGRHIAGTGTINHDGTVGDIGGVDKKVVAADRAGAEIFFAPDNPVTEEVKKNNPNAKSNYDEAVETAKKIKTKMKIVPVKTLQDAIDYLKKN